MSEHAHDLSWPQDDAPITWLLSPRMMAWLGVLSPKLIAPRWRATLQLERALASPTLEPPSLDTLPDTLHGCAALRFGEEVDQALEALAHETRPHAAQERAPPLGLLALCAMLDVRHEDRLITAHGDAPLASITGGSHARVSAMQLMQLPPERAAHLLMATLEPGHRLVMLGWPTTRAPYHACAASDALREVVIARAAEAGVSVTALSWDPAHDDASLWTLQLAMRCGAQPLLLDQTPERRWDHDAALIRAIYRLSEEAKIAADAGDDPHPLQQARATLEAWIAPLDSPRVHILRALLTQSWEEQQAALDALSETHPSDLHALQLAYLARAWCASDLPHTRLLMALPLPSALRWRMVAIAVNPHTHRFDGDDSLIKALIAWAWPTRCDNSATLIALARWRADEDDLDGAREACERVARDTPKCARGALEAALLLDRLGASGAARRRAYKRAIALNPWSVDAHDGLGRLLEYEVQDLAGARDCYERALSCHSSVGALCALGSVEAKAGRASRAMRLWQLALTLYPEHAWPLVALGEQLAYRMNDREGGLAYLAQAAARAPQDAYPLTAYAKLLADTEPVKAQALANRAISIDPDYLAAHYALNKALRCDASCDLEALARSYRELLAIAPEARWHRMMYANLLTDDLARHDEAEQMYKLAIASPGADQASVDALRCYGVFLEQLRHDPEAGLVQLERAHALAPDNLDVLSSLSILLEHVGRDRARAEAIARRLVALAPDQPDFALNLARLHIREDRDDEARALLAHVATLPNMRPCTRLEHAFYTLIMSAPAARAEAQARVEALLEEGARILGWDLSGELEAARRAGREDIGALTRLAGRIVRP